MWQTETLKAGKYGVTDERKHGEVKQSDKTRTKSILITQPFESSSPNLGLENLFLLWVCAIMQNVTVGDAISKGHKKCWYFTTKYLTRKFLWALYNLSSSSDILFTPLTAYCFSEAKNQYGRSDLVVFSTNRLSILRKNGRNETCFSRHLIKRK